MRMRELLRELHDTVGGTRVFGEPYERDGVTVITVTRLRGGGGGGEGGSGRGAPGRGGHVQPPEAEGAGGGFGLSATPVGAYVIRDGRVSWLPAVDVGRIVLGGQVIVGMALLVAVALDRRRRSRRG